MGIFIKNPDVERKARELAALRGKTLTAVINDALSAELVAARRAEIPRRKHTLEEMLAATEQFRRVTGLDKMKVKPMTKAEWDALWPTGIPEIDEL